MTASDGQLSVADEFTLTVNPVNDAPVIAGDFAISVDEGGRVTIATADLTGSDPDDDAADLTYTVSAPTNGYIARTGASATPITSFTQAELAGGAIMFVHDGSETLTASFDVVLSDNDGATAGARQTVNVAVTEVNDEPDIQVALYDAETDTFIRNINDGVVINASMIAGRDLTMNSASTVASRWVKTSGALPGPPSPPNRPHVKKSSQSSQ